MGSLVKCLWLTQAQDIYKGYSILKCQHFFLSFHSYEIVLKKMIHLSICLSVSLFRDKDIDKDLFANLHREDMSPNIQNRV